MKLRRENIGVSKWLKTQSQKSNSRLNLNDIDSLIRKVFADDVIITPNCGTEFAECPYYRFSEVLDHLKDEINDSIDDETLRYIQIISNNVDSIMNEIDSIRERIKLPDAVLDTMRESIILSRLEKKIQFFDLTFIQEHLTLLREFEIYTENCERVRQYEAQLKVYHQAGVENHLKEIAKQKDLQKEYENQITVLGKELISINKQFDEIDSNIAIVTKYNDSKKYVKIFESTIESTKKILIPLENASKEKMELEFRLRQIENAIESYRSQYRDLDVKISEYRRLIKESEILSKKNKDLSIILDSVSTKKGIPVFYMKKYLKKIQKLSNQLLSLIYENEFRLSSFNVTPETFEIPYVKNGKKIPDIKYASQSEVALATMALSFALASNTSSNYNILLLDEIDNALDPDNRNMFLSMLYKEMEIINAEQVFVISQNMGQLANIPMDCIKLTDVTTSKLQNVIYE